MIENAKLSESKVLNENKSKIIKIKRVNIEYKRKIFVTCFSISELLNEIKFVRVFLNVSSYISIR